MDKRRPSNWHFHKEVRIGSFEFAVTWNKSLHQFHIWIGARNPEFSRLTKNGKKQWVPFIEYRNK